MVRTISLLSKATEKIKPPQKTVSWIWYLTALGNEATIWCELSYHFIATTHRFPIYVSNRSGWDYEVLNSVKWLRRYIITLYIMRYNKH